MESESFFSETGNDEAPMTVRHVSEGLKKPKFARNIVAFDIETYSPRSFPYQAEDPVVNFSLVAPIANKGFLALSAIVEVNMERELLSLLRLLLLSFNGACLLTYNGSKFDIEYVVRRGKLCGLNFRDVFAGLRHVDVYQLLKWLNVKFPRYDQKTVENCLGIRRAIPHVCGSSYHLFYNDFIGKSDLTAMFYNIEDSFGCLKIAGCIPSILRGMYPR